MKLVLLTALGVGGATLIGAVIGFVFKKRKCFLNKNILQKLFTKCARLCII